MTFSFVIPVYNTAQYIDRCIGSIINQGLNADSFEIIIINDGSTDNSKQMLEKWAGLDSIKVIHTENKGLGAARNVGLDVAIGRYVFFVDSDDYILDGSLCELIQFAENTDCDIISFNWLVVHPNGKRSIVKNNKIPYQTIMSGAEYMVHYNIKAGACFYLYRNSFLKDASLTMPEGIYHEDELFLPKAFLHANKITFIDKTVYAYCLRNNSISRRKDTSFLHKRIADKIYVLDSLIFLSKDSSLNSLQQQGLERKITFLTVDILIDCVQNRASNDILNQTIIELKKRHKYPLLKKNYGCKYLSTRIAFNSKQLIKFLIRIKTLVSSK